MKQFEMKAKTKAQETERPLSPHHAVLYGQIVSLELALLECNQLGIDVERVDYSDFRRPRLIVRDNWATQQIKRSGKFKANSYGLKLNHGRRTFLHCAEIRGVRIIWESGEF